MVVWVISFSFPGFSRSAYSTRPGTVLASDVKRRRQSMRRVIEKLFLAFFPKLPPPPTGSNTIIATATLLRRWGKIHFGSIIGTCGRRFLLFNEATINCSRWFDFIRQLTWIQSFLFLISNLNQWHQQHNGSQKYHASNWFSNVQISQ